MALVCHPERSEGSDMKLRFFATLRMTECLLIVRRLFSDGYRVRMRLFHSSGSYSDKSRVFPHLRDATGADIAHAATETANDLFDDIRKRAFVFGQPLHAFGDFRFRVFLEIPV